MRNILMITVCCLVLAFTVSMAAAQEAAPPASPAAPSEQAPATMEKPAAPPAEQAPSMETPATAPAEQPAAKPAKHKGRKHMASEKVKAVQEALNKAGAQLNADGKMGKTTRKALKKYQKENGLKVTGKPDAETLAKMGIQ